MRFMIFLENLGDKNKRFTHNICHNNHGSVIDIVYMTFVMRLNFEKSLSFFCMYSIVNKINRYLMSNMLLVILDDLQKV